MHRGGGAISVAPSFRLAILIDGSSRPLKGLAAAMPRDRTELVLIVCMIVCTIAQAVLTVWHMRAMVLDWSP